MPCHAGGAKKAKTVRGFRVAAIFFFRKMIEHRTPVSPSLYLSLAGFCAQRGRDRAVVAAVVVVTAAASAAPRASV